MLLEEKMKISEVSTFSILRFRNDKDELKQKLKGQQMLLEEEKVKISEVSEFSILPYT